MAALKFDEVPFVRVKEGVQRKLIMTDELMTVLIDFSTDPWKMLDPLHSHPHQQTLYVAKGEIVFFAKTNPDHHFKAGDMYAVPSGKKYTIKLLSETARRIDPFYPVREDFL